MATEFSRNDSFPVATSSKIARLYFRKCYLDHSYLLLGNYNLPHRYHYQSLDFWNLGDRMCYYFWESQWCSTPDWRSSFHGLFLSLYGSGKAFVAIPIAAAQHHADKSEHKRDYLINSCGQTSYCLSIIDSICIRDKKHYSTKIQYNRTKHHIFIKFF